MDLNEKIIKQINAGYTRDEIYENLLSDGHSKEEIDREYAVVSKEVKSSNQVSTKGLVFGFIFLIIVIFRIFRFSNSSGTGAVLGFITIITGIILMIMWFSKKKD
jgi:hypothetical protein